MDRELESLIKNDTWEITEKLDKAKVLRTRWVFKQKRAENGKLNTKLDWLYKDVLKPRT